MVYGAQYGAVRPTGMKKKKGRMAPIIEEQAKQGIATRMVTDAKARAQQEEEWAFNKSSRESELALMSNRNKMMKKQAKHNKTMDYIGAGISGLSTAFNVIDTFTGWLG